VTLPYVSLAYTIGDRIDLIRGRNVSLRTNVGSGQGEAPTYPWIEQFPSRSARTLSRRCCNWPTVVPSPSGSSDPKRFGGIELDISTTPEYKGELPSDRPREVTRLTATRKAMLRHAVRVRRRREELAEELRAWTPTRIDSDAALSDTRTGRPYRFRGSRLSRSRSASLLSRRRCS
jgi:hypothetical protein